MARWRDRRRALRSFSVVGRAIAALIQGINDAGEVNSGALWISRSRWERTRGGPKAGFTPIEWGNVWKLLPSHDDRLLYPP